MAGKKGQKHAKGFKRSKLKWKFDSMDEAISYFGSLYYTAIEEDKDAWKTLEQKAALIKRCNGHYMVWLGKRRPELLIEYSGRFLEHMEFLTGNQAAIDKAADLEKQKSEMMEKFNNRKANGSFQRP